ncbi:MAG: DNA repair protein RecO [Candidatus Sericytochromatia bacterium]|nr:DNA repair protein RecO [Candidatus Sericytochromatia bacterium]
MGSRDVAAIILRTRPWGEQDKLVQAVSREEGTLSAVARGAAKPGNRWGGRLEPLGRRYLTLAGGNRGGPPVLSGVSPREAGTGVYRDLERIMAGMGIAEAVLAIWPEGLPQEGLFNRIDGLLGALAEGADVDRVLTEAQWLLLHDLGEAPDLDVARLPAGCGPGDPLGRWLRCPEGPMPGDGKLLAASVAAWLATAADRPLRGQAVRRRVLGTGPAEPEAPRGR